MHYAASSCAPTTEELKFSRHIIRSRHFFKKLVDLSDKLPICQMRSSLQRRVGAIDAPRHAQFLTSSLPTRHVKATRCLRVAAQNVDVDFEGFVDYINTTQQQILSSAESLEGNNKTFIRDRWDRGGAAEPNAGDYLADLESKCWTNKMQLRISVHQQL